MYSHTPPLSLTAFLHIITHRDPSPTPTHLSPTPITTTPTPAPARVAFSRPVAYPSRRHRANESAAGRLRRSQNNEQTTHHNNGKRSAAKRKRKKNNDNRPNQPQTKPNNKPGSTRHVFFAPKLMRRPSRRTSRFSPRAPLPPPSIPNGSGVTDKIQNKRNVNKTAERRNYDNTPSTQEKN